MCTFCWFNVVNFLTFFTLVPSFSCIACFIFLRICLMFISLSLCKTSIIAPFFRSMWQHRLNQPVADSILLHCCPGGISAPQQEPFYWCKKRDCKFIIKKATITRNYTRLHTTIIVPANNRGYSDCTYEPLITAQRFTTTESFSCIFRIRYIIIINTGRMERFRFPQGHLNISFILNKRVTLIS